MKHKVSRIVRLYEPAFTLLMGCLLLAVFPARLKGQEGEAASDWRRGWEFTFVPYAWALGVDGDVTVGGSKSNVDMSFSDIWDDLNAALMGDLYVRKGRFGFFARSLYGQIQNESKTRLPNAVLESDSNLDLFIMSFGVEYGLGPYRLTDRPGAWQPRVTIEPLAGGRYTYLHGDLDLKPLLSEKGTQDWVEPILGARTIWDLTERWNVVLSGNLGGFNVGDSDFSWEAVGLLGYRFSLFSKTRHNANVLAGYRALYMDYEDGSGANKFAWDATISGPVLGLSLNF